MLCTSVMTQCSTADSSLSRPSSRAVSPTSAGSTSARLASRQSKKRVSSSSSAASDSQATSKSSDSRAWRQATSVLVLPLPAGPCTTMQRLRRASSMRASSASRAIRRRPRGGCSLVLAMGSSRRAGVPGRGG